MPLTKQDLEAIKEVIRTEVGSDLVLLKQDVKEIKNDLNGLREQIQQLTISLDKFLKRLTDHEEEFTILKSEMKQVKQVIKEKLGIEFKGVANW